MDRPWWDQRWIANAFWQISLIPLIWLTALHWIGRRDAAWWWLAGSFGISWLADLPHGFISRDLDWIPSLVYPVSQSAIVWAVLMPRRSAVYALIVLVVACASVVVFSGVGPEIALRGLAWLSIVWIVWKRPQLPQRLRVALAVYYGLGWCLWVVHVRWLVVATWYSYQANRLVGIGLFCWALLETRTRLHLHPMRGAT